MFCIHCGKEIPDNSTFCTQCGKPITPTPKAETDVEADTKKTNAQKESTDNSLRELAGTLWGGLLGEDGIGREDASCPFCGEPSCQPLQKNTTEVNSKGYSFGSGCCGMFFLGPFGLLCGLCGAGSNVKIRNELWWTCPKCGKQHISMDDAMKKWDAAVSGLPGIGVLGGIIFIICNWLSEEVFSLLALGVLGAIPFPIMMLVGTYQTITGELGEPLFDYLSAKQKKKCAIMAIVSTLLVFVVGLWGIPILLAILGE